MSGCHPVGGYCYCLCHRHLGAFPPARCVCNCNKQNNFTFSLTDTSSIYVLEEKVKNLETRLKELEDWTHADEDRIYDRIKTLEEITKRITEDDMKAGRKPHKCPICDGEAFVPISNDCESDMDECHGCEGEGIVWG